jgi:hypothetical protein
MRSVVVPCAHFRSNEEIIGLITLLVDMQLFATLQTAKSDLIGAAKAITNPDARSRVFTLLAKLRESSRLLDCKEFGGPCADACVCSAELGAASFVVSDGCDNVGGSQVVQLAQYAISRERDQLLQTDFSHYESRSRDEWESTVLVPLFKFAKALYIIDYIAGRNLGEFRDSLEWIIGVFRRSAPIGPIVLFTSAEDPALRRECALWAKRFNIRLEFRVYSARRPDSMQHDRFLITQSFGLQIGRGLNILSGQRVLPTSLHIVRKPADVLNACYRAAKV